MRSDELAHYGVKGMKWGVRHDYAPKGRQKVVSNDSSGSSSTSSPKAKVAKGREAAKKLGIQDAREYGVENTRTLKKGTEIQNISKTKLDSKSKKSNRLYGAYTDSDKAEYLDMMGNFEYEGKGYKNTFKVKSDIKIASEREVVRTMAEMFRDNPKQMSDMMATAYNAVNVPILFSKSGKGFEKKLSRLAKDPESEKALKLGRKFIQTVPMTNKSSDLANDFYGRMVKKGFDAVLDTNDAYGAGGTQDPLIIFNMSKLGQTKSVELTKDDLDAASDYVLSREFSQKKKDRSGVTHSAMSN